MCQKKDVLTSQLSRTKSPGEIRRREAWREATAGCKSQKPSLLAQIKAGGALGNKSSELGPVN